MTFDADQAAAIDAVIHGTGDRIITGGAGSGKCLGAGTPIIMHDGTVKLVERIVPGDVLMGPDSKPRTVTSVTRGLDEMYRIRPKNGDSFICNESHILSVKHTKKLWRHLTTDKHLPFNMSVADAMRMPEKQRNELQAWRTPVEFPHSTVPLDPYFLGVWLGDGSHSQPSIHKPDIEIESFLIGFAERMGLRCSHTKPTIGKCPRHTLACESRTGFGRYNRNPITKVMREIGVMGNKHIPHIYKANSRSVRLALLAGIIDTDGYAYCGGTCCEISSGIPVLAMDIVFLARSLGFAVSHRQKTCSCQNGYSGAYTIIHISGDLSVIPTLIARKKFMPRRQVKNVLHTGISIEPIGIGEYFGFTLAESDGLFLLGDFTVTHNTTIIRTIADHFRGECELMTPTGKAAARLTECTGHPACTIHRALAYDGDRFFRTTDLPFTIIDEASMVDSSLFAAVLRFKPRRLLLVGDAAQLAPVGRGQPFHDLIRLRPDLVSTLRTCHRASGAVHHAAQAIRNGERPAMKEDSGGERWAIQRTGTPEDTTASILSWIDAGRFDQFKDIVLGPQYGTGTKEDDGSTDGGIRAINAAIKAKLNPSTEPFAPGDRVICCKNFGTEDLWNGDLGTISDMDTSGKPEIRLDRDERNPRQLNTEQSRELRHAWCLSVHKAQGSQFRRVIFAAFNRNSHMLSRPLCYTAVTRAQEAVVVCGETEAFFKGIGTVPVRSTVMQALAEEDVL